ncbi:MAG: hydrogenase [Deltaproteobacteria bacterium]|nr:hydrogenase [Deltaproteobacteria bacterium]
MITGLVLAALVLVVVSGLAPLAFARGSVTGARVGTLGSVVACALGFVAAALALAGAAADPIVAPWALPLGRFAVGVDAPSAAFLMLIFAVGGACVTYGHGYRPAASAGRHVHGDACLRAVLGVCIAALGFVVIATDAILFLVAWEIMALSCFFLVTTEDHDPDVRAAGWIYLVATHLATLVLIAMCAVMRAEVGSFDLTALPASAGAGARGAMFLLALFAFGLKAGLMPLHVWLPSAHASAPSHVSALMSGVMIKMGVYGLVRFLALIPHPPASWGAILLVLGVVSAIAGVLFALGQHDLKRLLAYHSIENVGIIVMGLGLAMLGRAYGEPVWIALGLGGAILHTWNHGLFKALLFLGAGSVIHATGTRVIDHMGGLARHMRWTAALFLVGALAICGLPPLNGFVSELLLYLGLLDTGVGQAANTTAPAAALALPALALVGALAVACFVKVYGVVFLGEPRTPAASRAHEAHPSMLAAMAVLAGLCGLIGLAPVALASPLDRVVAAWPSIAPPPPLADAAPLTSVSLVAVTLLAALVVAVLVLRRRIARRPHGAVAAVPAVPAVPTWDCGYARPSATMQYTASSFAQKLVRLFGWALRPSLHRPHLPPAVAFPGPTAFSSHVAEPVLERVVMPLVGRGARMAHRLRFIQQGRLQPYVLYILVALLILFAWLLPLDALVDALFGGGGAYP